MTIDHNQLTAQMLLGKLPEEQRVEMEQHFFADQALFDELLIAENELIDSYAAGRLSPEDRSLFEERFLLSPRQHRRVIFADALANYASRESRVAVPEAAGSLERFWASISSLFVTRTLALSFGAIGLVVIMTAAILLIKRPGNEPMTDAASVQSPPAALPSSDNREIAQTNTNEAAITANGNAAAVPHNSLPHKAPAAARPTTIVSTILLTMGATRGSAGSKSYTIPAKATAVRIRLALDDSTYTVYTAVVETVEGRQIASQRAIRNGSTVNITLPASRLAKGDYIIILKGAKKNAETDTIGEYSFTID